MRVVFVCIIVLLSACSFVTAGPQYSCFVTSAETAPYGTAVVVLSPSDADRVGDASMRVSGRKSGRGRWVQFPADSLTITMSVYPDFMTIVVLQRGDSLSGRVAFSKDESLQRQSDVSTVKPVHHSWSAVRVNCAFNGTAGDS